jgi:hypothetical protein
LRRKKKSEVAPNKDAKFVITNKNSNTLNANYWSKHVIVSAVGCGKMNNSSVN